MECNICCRESDAFGIGDCNHPFCMECVIRLRIIAKINSCPTCRADIDKVKFLYYKFFSFLFKFLLVLFFAYLISLIIYYLDDLRKST